VKYLSILFIHAYVNKNIKVTFIFVTHNFIVSTAYNVISTGFDLILLQIQLTRQLLCAVRAMTFTA